jgi:uncharacterized membrane protein
MDENGLIALLVLALLAVPLAIFILLIVCLVKTRNLSREVSRLEHDVTGLKADLRALAAGRPVGAIEYTSPGLRTREQPQVRPAEPPMPVVSPQMPPPTEPPVSPAAEVPTSADLPAAAPPSATPAGVPPRPVPPSTSLPGADETAPPAQAPPVKQPPTTPSYGGPKPPQRPAWDLPDHMMDSVRQGSPSGAEAGSVRPDAIRYEPLATDSSYKTKPPMSGSQWESLIGGRLLNWIGALATIIGIGLFLGYAFQNNWIPPTMRVLIGVAAGLGLLVGGNYSYKKDFTIFSQGLIGAGISILYLSVYASFNFYHLVGQKAAFGMMAAVTAITFFQAFRFDSLAVSILGWAGGFLTPVLLSTGEANEIGLFSYVALLTAGLLAIVAFKRSWIVLQPMTLAGTYLLYVVWYSKFYSPADLLTTLIFLTIFWSLFLAVDVFWMVNKPGPLAEVRETVGIFNAVFYYTAVYIVVHGARPDLTGFIILAVGAVYFLIVLTVTSIEWDGVQFNRYLLTAIVLLVLAIAHQFSGFNTAIAWSIAAAVIVFCAVRWKLYAVMVAGLLIYGAAFIKLFATDGWDHFGPSETFTLLLNQRALAFICVGGLSAAGAFILRSSDQKAVRLARAALNYAWCLLLFVLVTVETDDLYIHLGHGPTGDQSAGLEYRHQLIRAMIWMFCSLPLVWYGIEEMILPLVYSGYVMLAASVVQVLISGANYEPISRFALGLNVRAGIMLVILAGLLLQAYWAKKHDGYRWGRQALIWVLTMSCAVLFVLGTAEARDYYHWIAINLTPDKQEILWFREAMVTVIIWSVYAVALLAIGMRKKLTPVVVCASVGLCFALALALIVGVGYVPIAGFTLALNLRVLAFASVIAALLLISALVNRGRSGKEYIKTSAMLAVVVALTICYLLTIETKDYFGKEILLSGQGLMGALTTAQAGSLSASIHSLGNLRQMTLSLVWVVYSILLIGFGIWRRMLVLRIVAISLTGIAILKIFFYDLGFLETKYRIISFIGLGLILLAISFLYQKFKSVISEPSSMSRRSNDDEPEPQG